MKTIKITLTPEQRIQLAHAATLEIDLPDYDQLANELQSAKTTLEAIAALLNPNGYTGLSLVELVEYRLTKERLSAYEEGGSAQKAFWDGFERALMSENKNIRAHWNCHLELMANKKAAK